MSNKHQFHNPDGVYFVSFSTVYWTDVFTRNIYREFKQAQDYLYSKAGIIAEKEGGLKYVYGMIGKAKDRLTQKIGVAKSCARQDVPTLDTRF